MLRTVNLKPSLMRDILFSALSAVLLILSFPKTNFSFLAWFAFVPLLSIMDGKTLQQAFRRAYLTGFIFFMGVLTWIHFVTWTGLIALSLYLAVYFGIFGAFYAAFSNKKPAVKIFLLPSVWVVFELIRSFLFSGFSWGALGLSQYQNLPLIQTAEITGVAGISFLVMMINVFIKDFKSMKQLWAVPFLIFCLVFAFGFLKLHEKNPLNQVRVGVVQGNVDQDLKWKPEEWPGIMNKHKILSRQAADYQPELIIWPETSFPGFLWDDTILFNDLKNFQKSIGPAILVGSVTQYGGDYYNSALLLTTNARTDLQQYHKMHLVAFGEFIPFRELLPFLAKIVPIVDFTAGRDFKVFQLNMYHFSVLICFEDTVPDLTRRFVKNGAQFLVNITNDGWFKDTKEPYMHLQSSVFRAVENRRSIVRSANTGISGFIDPYGRMIKQVENEKGKSTYVEGTAVEEVQYSNQMTFYTRFGDIFAYICLAYLVFCIIIKRQEEKIIS